jgi:signal recognition particle subunit SRP54
MNPEFTLNDFRSQLALLERKNWADRAAQLSGLPVDSDFAASLSRSRAILDAMTAEERVDPKRIDANAARRIATDAGTDSAEVEHVLRSFDEIKAMRKRIASMSIWERSKLTPNFARFRPPLR